MLTGKQKVENSIAAVVFIFTSVRRTKLFRKFNWRKSESSH